MAKSRNVIGRPSQAVIPSYVTPRGGRVSIATTPFRVVCGPTTTTLLPTMILPSLPAADLRAQDRFGSKNEVAALQPAAREQEPKGR
jgi:hypothetical protein